MNLQSSSNIPTIRPIKAWPTCQEATPTCQSSWTVARGFVWHPWSVFRGCLGKCDHVNLCQWKIVSPPHILQNDNINCGIFIRYYVHQLIHDHSLTNPFDPYQFRSYMYHSLTSSVLLKFNSDEDYFQLVSSSSYSSLISSPDQTSVKTQLL